MNLDSYDLDTKSNFLSFEFYSEGPKGKTKKIIQFRRLHIPGSENDIYNLAFGDLKEAEGTLDDLAVSDNKDSEKVLATVAAAVVLFIKQNPDVWVFAQGSTYSRTRYYMMGITKHFTEIARAFEIWGALSDTDWELFRKNRPYKALLVKRK